VIPFDIIDGELRINITYTRDVWWRLIWNM
jgi:hypothetical protein